MSGTKIELVKETLAFVIDQCKSNPWVLSGPFIARFVLYIKFYIMA